MQFSSLVNVPTKHLAKKGNYLSYLLEPSCEKVMSWWTAQCKMLPSSIPKSSHPSFNSFCAYKCYTFINMDILSLTVVFNPVPATAHTNARIGEGVMANLTSFQCHGTESGLLNCKHVMSSCSIMQWQWWCARLWRSCSKYVSVYHRLLLLPTLSSYPGCRQLKQTMVMRGSFSYLRTSTNCIKQPESKLSHADILATTVWSKAPWQWLEHQWGVTTTAHYRMWWLSVHDFILSWWQLVILHMKTFRLQDVIVGSLVPLLTTASFLAYSIGNGYRKWLHTMQHHKARLSIQLIQEHMHVLAFIPWSY